MGNFNRDRGSSGGRGFGKRNFGGRGGGRSFDRGSERREMFKTVCSNCGKDCEVPFRPSGDKPVYCSDCFEKMRGSRNDSPRPQRSDFRSPAPSFDSNKGQFDSLNAKLNRIIALLEPKVSTPEILLPEVSTPVEKEAKKVKAPKTKKVVKKTAPPD